MKRLTILFLIIGAIFASVASATPRQSPTGGPYGVSTLNGVPCNSFYWGVYQRSSGYLWQCNNWPTNGYLVAEWRIVG